MILNDQELEATQERIRHLHIQLAHLRNVETNPSTYRVSASGFLAEVDRVQLEVREYLALHPTEPAASPLPDQGYSAAVALLQALEDDKNHARKAAVIRG